jgi:hypothetical protein
LIALITCLAGAAVSCKRPPKIDVLRDTLARDDANAIRSATSDLPSCPDLPPTATPPGEAAPRDRGCLTEIANALGSKRGYVVTPPDQAAAAATAVVLARDGRGDWIGHVGTWLGALRMGTGAGIDALRLAVTDAMVRAAPSISTAADLDEEPARATMKAVAVSVPGACSTYWLLGTGAAVASLEAALSPDHSACVQADLGVPSGPGPSWGSGFPRAGEAARAIWRETALALRTGTVRAAPSVRPLLEKRLGIIEARLAPLTTVMRRSRGPTTYLSAIHADAGILIEDAGARTEDAGVKR